MPEDNRNGAVIYLRVSTKEQADDPFNLSKQEKICKDFCAGKGLAVTKIFTDPGQSGRTAERPEFQRMVQFCKQRRREIGFVIVQNLSRFARNSRDQAHFIAELRAHQIALCSVYEPNVNDTAPGKFAANMIGASNQYFSDALSESTRDRMRAAVAAGRFRGVLRLATETSVGRMARIWNPTLNVRRLFAWHSTCSQPACTRKQKCSAR